MRGKYEKPPPILHRPGPQSATRLQEVRVVKLCNCQIPPVTCTFATRLLLGDYGFLSPNSTPFPSKWHAIQCCLVS